MSYIFMFFRQDFRVLMAGGGTGATTMFLAEQLNHTKSEVVYLDFSTSSMKIAQIRAKIRELKNIIWVTEGIENIHRLNLNKFNFIQCSGVLHHLKLPTVGLRTLKDVLHLSGGGIDLMVYGTYGRIGVYHIQHALKLLNSKRDQIMDELKTANTTLQNLPSTNWFKREEYQINDHLMGDAGIYDLFLHKRDISFTVPELLKWIENAGLSTIRYTSRDVPPISGDSENSKAYNIKHFDKIFNNDSKFIQSQMQKILELFYPNAMMQNALLSLNKDTVAKINDPENILFVPGNGVCPPGLQKRVRSIKESETYFNSSITENSKGSKFFIKWPLTDINKHLLNIFVRSECRIKLATLLSIFKKQIKSELEDSVLLQNFMP